MVVAVNRSMVIGYVDEAGMETLPARYWDNRGNWVEPLFPGDDIVVQRPTEQDRTVLGVGEGEAVLHVHRNATSRLEIYRMRRASFHPLPADARDWPDDEFDDRMRRAATIRFAPSPGTTGAQVSG
jgi:hypothetical protein